MRRPLNDLPREEFTKIRDRHKSGATILERIVYYSRPQPNGCVHWAGPRAGTHGRPILSIDGTGRKATVARLLWIYHKGAIPPGLIVRHLVCANLDCINVEHLAIGTHLDNAKDRETDGNTAKGTAHYRALLTEDQVREIRAHTISHRAAAKKYGVGFSTITGIRSGKTWKHLT